MNKIIKCIKQKLKKWLLEDELETIKFLERENERIQKLVTPLLDVGSDIGFYQDHSWAVICVKGKPEYVKFMSLDGKDTRNIIEFLRHYQQSNHVIDSPLSFRGIIRDELFI